MTQNEFKARYNPYVAQSENQARCEAQKVNQLGIDNDEAIAVSFTGRYWVLMLKSTYEFMLETKGDYR